MATTETRLRDLATAIGTDVKTLLGRIGALAGLTTTAKTDLVAAINEVNAKPAGASINDAATSGSTTWSSTKIANERAAVKAEILGAAGAATDTLEELKAYADSGQAADLVALGKRVRVDAAQSFTAPEKVQANANAGSLSLVQAGDPDTDLVGVYNTAKA